VEDGEGMKWRSYFTTTASTSFEVDADDYDGALAATERYEREHGFPTLCAQCSGWDGPGIELADWEPADEMYGPNIEQVDE
jgi:hypothetical protein